MLTGRGFGFVGLAVAAYLGGRLLGTYEFYVGAIAFAALVLLSWLVTLASGSRLVVDIILDPSMPLAGDPIQVSVFVANRSALPTSELTVTADLTQAAGEELSAEVSPVSPHTRTGLARTVGRARRGVHVLPAPRVSQTDPFGIACRRRRVGVETEVVVLPHISPLRTCVFFGGRGLGRLGQLRSALAHGSFELRGVRPHVPGDPLSRIDWKSTAKTGNLMLREVDEPARNEVALLIDGNSNAVVGPSPDDTYELAVAAAGSVGDFVLREGMGAALFLHGQTSEHYPCEGGEAGRMRLLRQLARARPDADTPLAEYLRRNEPALTRGMAVVVFTAAFDRGLLISLGKLRERGLPVYLVHVDSLSFTTPVDQEGRPLPVPDGPLKVEMQRFLLRLAQAGVPNVTVRRGDSLGEALSFPVAGVEHNALA